MNELWSNREVAILAWPSRFRPRWIAGVSWTGGEDFDTVVIEYRTLAREVHLEKAVDDDGDPVID
jgi:hypothetical protein